MDEGIRMLLVIFKKEVDQKKYWKYWKVMDQG